MIGAGAAGLAAGEQLTARGLRTVIVEARNRIGGRIDSLHDPRFPMPVELGAEFVHGRNVETWDLLRAANARAYFADGHHRHFRRGRLRAMDDFWEQIERVLARLERVKRGGDMSFAQFLRRHCKEPSLRRARELALSFVEGFEAADANLISAYSLAQSADASEEAAESFRIIDGYSSVPDFLLRAARQANLSLRLGAPVRAIRWKRGDVEVVIGDDSVVRARRAIVTVPVGVLRDGALRFEPDLPEKREAAGKIEMGQVVKVILKFARAFWEERALPAAREPAPDVVFMTSESGAAVPTWWTQFPVRSPVLTGWAGGPAAARLSHRPQEAVVGDALASLAGITGVPRARLAKMVVAAHVADWQADPLARGAYSYVTVGNADAPRALARPVEGTLFFAGEATGGGAGGVGGTVDAALASGRRAAREVLARIKGARA